MSVKKLRRENQLKKGFPQQKLNSRSTEKHLCSVSHVVACSQIANQDSSPEIISRENHSPLPNWNIAAFRSSICLSSSGTFCRNSRTAMGSKDTPLGHSRANATTSLAVVMPLSIHERREGQVSLCGLSSSRPCRVQDIAYKDKTLLCGTSGFLHDPAFQSLMKCIRRCQINFAFNHRRQHTLHT